MSLPLHAAGIGLRDSHATEIDRFRPAAGWLEVHTENLFGADPRRHHRMERLRADYPLSLHGVGLSLGSAEALDPEHLRQVIEIVHRYEPALVSEHASWGRFGGRHTHQLLPLPFTHEAASILGEHIQQLQDALGRTIAIEPVARYFEFADASMSEPAFLSEIACRTGCRLLIDISNLYINSSNHGFDPLAWMSDIPDEPVIEFHLAGFDQQEGMLIDTHDRPVDADVWALYEAALRHFGPRPTLIEWDAELPTLDVLLGERSKANALLNQYATVSPL